MIVLMKKLWKKQERKFDDLTMYFQLRTVKPFRSFYDAAQKQRIAKAVEKY